MAKQNKATEDELGEIHGGMAEWCRLVMQGIPLLNSEGAAVLRDDGTPWLIPPSPAHLNIIRQFLKDNKIDNPLTEDKLKDVTQDLPDFSGESAFH
jgi:hypothetical protein